MSLILKQVFWPDSLRGGGFCSEYTWAGFMSEIQNVYVSGSTEVPRRCERSPQVFVPGSTAGTPLSPSRVLWVCLLRWWISQTEILPTCFTSSVVGLGQDITLFDTFVSLLALLTSSSQVLRDLALSSFLSAHGPCHCSPSGPQPTFCLLTHFAPSITSESFSTKSQIASRHSCPTNLQWFPLSIWQVQIVLVGLKGHLKSGSKAPSYCYLWK